MQTEHKKGHIIIKMSELDTCTEIVDAINRSVAPGPERTEPHKDRSGERRDILNNNVNYNTLRQTLSSIRVFKTWLAERDDHRDPENIQPRELDLLIAQFLSTVRKRSDNPDSDNSNSVNLQYEPSTLVAFHSSICRYLLSMKYGVNIRKDVRFRHSREVLVLKMKQLKSLSKKKVTSSAKTFTGDKLQVLIQRNLLGTNNPQTIINSLWLNLFVHFGLHGSRNHAGLLWSDICLHVDESGLEYLEFEDNRARFTTVVSCSKVNKRVYANGTVYCPLAVYKEFAKRRHPDTCFPDSRFYVQPLSIYTDQIWFSRNPLGNKAIGRIRKDMTYAANLKPGMKTNISAEKTHVQTLKLAGLPPNELNQVSWYINVQPIECLSIVSDDLDNTSVVRRQSPCNNIGITPRSLCDGKHSEVRDSAANVTLSSDYDKLRVKQEVTADLHDSHDTTAYAEYENHLLSDDEQADEECDTSSDNEESDKEDTSYYNKRVDSGKYDMTVFDEQEHAAQGTRKQSANQRNVDTVMRKQSLQLEQLSKGSSNRAFGNQSQRDTIPERPVRSCRKQDSASLQRRDYVWETEGREKRGRQIDLEASSSINVRQIDKTVKKRTKVVNKRRRLLQSKSLAMKCWSKRGFACQAKSTSRKFSKTQALDIASENTGSRVQREKSRAAEIQNGSGRTESPIAQVSGSQIRAPFDSAVENAHRAERSRCVGETFNETDSHTLDSLMMQVEAACTGNENCSVAAGCTRVDWDDHSLLEDRTDTLRTDEVEQSPRGTRRQLEVQRNEKLQSLVEELLEAVDRSSSENGEMQSKVSRLTMENDRLRLQLVRLKYENVKKLNEKDELLLASQDNIAHLSERILDLESRLSCVAQSTESTTLSI